MAVAAITVLGGIAGIFSSHFALYVSLESSAIRPATSRVSRTRCDDAIALHRWNTANTFCRSAIIVSSYLIIFGLAIALLGMSQLLVRCIALRAKLTRRRIPDPSSDLTLRQLPLLLRRSWCLYVFLCPGGLKCESANKLTVYIFIGSLIIGTGILSKIAGTIVGVTGIAYVVLEWVPSIEPPANMREADVAGWGAEQV